MNETVQTHFTLVSVVFALGVGLAVALVAWIVSKAFADVPAEDREYKDPPPLAFRLVWWPVQWLAHYLGPLGTARSRAALQARLRRGGLDYSIGAGQFRASRAILAAIVGAAFLWVLGSVDIPRPGSTGLASSLYVQVALVGALLGWAYPALWLRDRLLQRRRDLQKSLPFFLDITTLCVEAGLNVQGAMNQAVAKGPSGPLRDEFQRALRDIRAGKGRAQALRDMADRIGEPGVTHFATAVIQAEIMGMSLGPILRAQADQRRSERFLRAEKLAMEAPVKLLLPLIAFIFPCTFIVLFFPIVMKFLHSGV